MYLWYYFSLQFEQIFPYWVLGMVLGSIISVFAKDKIHGVFCSLKDKNLGIIIASVLDIVSPLCMYGTIPIAASFSKGGMKDDWLAAFMMSSILLNPQIIIYSTALGRTALAIQFVSCFICGIVAGLLVSWLYRGRSFFDFSGFEELKIRDTNPNMILQLFKNSGYD